MAEPELDHRPIDMLEVLPAEMAEVYASSEKVFKGEAELAKGHGELCRRFSRFGGPRAQWVEYMNRPIAAQLWVLVPEAQAVATTGVA